MEHIIAKFLQDFEQGKMSRRQLIQSLALTATTASALSAPAISVPAAPAISLNHVSYQVADYAKTCDFYAGMLGMKVSEDDGKQCRLSVGDNILIARNGTSNTPRVDHIGYTIANFDKDKETIRAELKRRGLQVREYKTSFHILDPDGFDVQLGPMRQ